MLVRKKKETQIFVGHLLQDFNVHLGKHDFSEENACGDISFIH